MLRDSKCEIMIFSCFCLVPYLNLVVGTNRLKKKTANLLKKKKLTEHLQYMPGIVLCGRILKMNIAK